MVEERYSFHLDEAHLTLAGLIKKFEGFVLPHQNVTFHRTFSLVLSRALHIKQNVNVAS